MGRLIGLIVCGFLLYQGYQYAAPWIEERLKSSGGSPASGRATDSEDEDSYRCLSSARNAARTLGDAMRQFAQPPVNQQEWSSAFIGVSGEVGAAQNACVCPTEACDLAAEAVDELRELSLSFDGIARGGSSRGIGNPARDLERVYDLLDEAESLSGP